jgi:chromosome segregation ATPase
MKSLKLSALKYFPIAIFLFTSISCAHNPTDSLNKESQRHLSFYEIVEGKSIHWEVNFDGNKITSIYKNGEKIPDDLVSDYKDKVYRELDEMRFGGKFYSFKMPDIDINMDELHKNMDDLEENFKNFEWHWEEFEFDDEKLKQQMEGLEEKLKDKKFEKFHYKFDDEKLKERLEKLEDFLKEHFKDFELKYDFDGENNDDEV